MGVYQYCSFFFWRIVGLSAPLGQLWPKVNQIDMFFPSNATYFQSRWNRHIPPVDDFFQSLREKNMRSWKFDYKNMSLLVIRHMNEKILTFGFPNIYIYIYIYVCVIHNFLFQTHSRSCGCKLCIYSPFDRLRAEEKQRKCQKHIETLDHILDMFGHFWTFLDNVTCGFRDLPGWRGHPSNPWLCFDTGRRVLTCLDT